MTTFLNLFSLAALFLLCNHASGVAVTGIRAGVNNITGERPFRQEINELYMSGPGWDLFVLALRQFQQVNQDDPLSYYQVAGIHGLPQVPYDGVVGRGDYPGYCAHGAVIFPTWHRPYIALFEQILWKHAQSIARSYPVRQRESYVAAALRLRMPYWDAFASPSFPTAASLPNLMVNTPNGTQSVVNPLYNYTFHADEGGNRLPSDHWLKSFPWTVRHWNTANQRSNTSDLNAALEHQYDSVAPLTYKLFASVSDYSNMSCTTSRGNSVENIHNLVHNAVGGHGHMSDTAASAFDPIFWLHHTNIDRLFAMWQVINPQSYVVPTVNTLGSYAEPRGFVDTADSALLPFHSDNETGFWTSTGVRSTRTFGYTYKEVMDWNVTQATLASNVRRSVSSLYNPTRVDGTSEQKITVTPITQRADLQPGISHVARTMNSHECERQWIITVEIQRFAHRSPFLIDFFVGSPPINPAAWSIAPNLVGSHAQFIATNSHPMHSNGLPDALSHGEVSLTHYLTAAARRSTIANLEPASVIPFLIKSLTWRARDMEGCELVLESLAGLAISVGSQVVQPAKKLNQFTKYGEMEVYANITAGKPGGIGKTHSPDAGCDHRPRPL